MSLLPNDPTRKPIPPSSTPSKESQAKPKLAVLPLEDRVVPAGQVVGTVFLDFNANGLLDTTGTLSNNGNGSTPLAAEGGVGGVVVTAFDAANVAQGSATSAANGQYTLALGNTGPYRLEFTNLPTGMFYGPQGSGATGSGTGVQFVVDNPPATPINLGLVDPTQIVADNPTLLSNIYVLGENPGAAVVSFPYSSGTENSDTTLGNYALNTPTSVADNTVSGATWGLAFNPANNTAYAAAMTKRHTAYGIGGPGAIYALDPTGVAAPTLFADLNALVSPSVAGANFRGALGAGYDYITDLAAFDLVGKTGLGGLAVDDTGTFMYTVGLADRLLYRIRIPTNGAAPTGADVTAFNIPLPATVTGVGGANGALGDLRPFAVEFHNGIVYVGAVNSAESTALASDLRAYVFAFNPASSGGPSFVNLAGAGTTTEAVFSQLLNYPRGFAHIGDTAPSTPATQIQAEWNAWTNTRVTLADTAGGERYAIYPQPELTGLAFDSNGNLTLGLRDRNGDQYGNFLTTDFVGTPPPGTKGISAGDTLRATIVTPGNLSSGWTAENITAEPPPNITGPTVGGQFFWQQDLPPNGQPTVNDHQALSVGGVLQLPGRDQVLVTGFDPIHISGQYDLGGVRWFDTTGGNAGGINKAYQAYLNTPTGFAKANGIGDLIAATQLGREIGNRVWNDANGNGRQDPGEAGIQNVSVVLCQVTGGVTSALATATTDANGDYYFSSYAGASTANKRYGITQLGGLIPAGTSYEICIPVSDPALAGLQLTPFQNAGTNTQNDSDGVLSGANYLIQSVGTQQLGTAQHSNDVGFLVANASLSGFVYEDSTPSNTFNAGDNPLAGVTVVLNGVTSGGTTITPLTTTTDGTGAYSFTGLAGGTYTVTETQPAGYLNRGEQPGSTGGTAPQNGTVISAIPLAPGQASINNNFGEVLPAQLAGNVYHDITNDGTFNAGDALITNVTLVLTGTDDLGAAVTLTQVSGAGAYAFTNLRPGTYSVAETQPAGFVTRTNTPGTVFTPGTGTPGTVVGDVIQSVVLNSNANNPDNNFGEVLAANASLRGFVYEDNDRSSSFNAGDTPVGGATVILTGTLSTGGTITPLTSTTAADGSYSFANLQPGAYQVNETQPAGLLDFNDQIGSTGGTAGNDVLSAIPVDNGANVASVNNNFGEVRPVQLSGFVYHDINNDGTRNAGDAAIGGVTVVLTGTDDLGNAVTPVTSTTAADGSYSFTALRPGDYTVSETQPAGFVTRTNNPGTAFAPGTGTAGTVVGDAIQTVRLNSNANSPDNNFGEVLAANASLSGFVYIDADNDGTFDGGEAPIGGATVILTGTLSTGGTATPQTTTTDGTGAYSFVSLLPGTYSVQEIQPTTPANLLTGMNTVGTVTNGTPGTAGAVGDDNIRNVVLNSFGNSPNNNFGEVVAAQLAGSVYEDLNDDGTFNAGDAALAGVTLVLTGTNDLGAITPVTVTTAADGSYSFTALRPGTYTVSETQPAGFLSRTNTAGATTNGTPGTVVGDAIQTVVLNSAGNSPGNNFGEVRPVQLSGSVYHDVNDDGTFDAGDAPLAGVTLVLTGTDDLGAPVTPATVTTAADGSYSFANLRPGTYSVSETQPAGYTDRTNTPGTVFTPGTGTPGTVVGDVIQNVVLLSNANNPANNFGERSAARVSGFVYEDLNDSNSLTNGVDRPIAGVTVVLTGTVAGGGAITPLTMTTAANGSYSFANLRPGTYTVTETQPAGFLNRGEQPGTTGGTAPQNGVLISAIPLAVGADSQNNNFGEVRPVVVAGNVYHDVNDNGVFDAGDVLLPNTTLTLTGTDDLGAAVSLVQVTGGGAYAFTGLRPGTYTVAETQPAGFSDRTNNPGPAFNGTPGTVNGDTIQTITLRSDGNSPANNFGEKLLPATLSGYVYRDPNLNGVREPGNGNEPGLGNVTVRLFREDGPGVLTQVGQAQTDSNGFYEFTGLAAGLYRVIETQPVGFYSTKDAAGTTGGNAPGNDTITTIPLAAGQNSQENDFGEVPRTNLFGYVWVDDNRNGIFDPGEAPVPGAVVNINGTAFTDTTIAQPLTPGLAQGPLTAITDASGRWDFLTLPPGNYNLVQTNTPAGLQDFRSQNASGQPVATSTATTFGGVSALTPAEGPLNFGKVSSAPPVVPTKQNFLGSTSGGTASAAATNPLIDPAIGSVNTTPPFAVGTGNPAVPAYVAVAAGAGFTPTIRVFDYATQTEKFRLQAFETGMTAGVRVTTGDITGDGVPDIIATVGPGGGPRVRVFDGATGAAVRDFYAYPPDFRGGLYVAAADFNGDGLADIVTGAGEGGGPNVRVFDGATGQLLTSFYAFNGNQTGGARIAVGDFNGDGTPDIAASNGPGNTSLIRVFSGNGFGQISQFVPYSNQYTGGVFLAAGDLDGDGTAELVTGADQGGGPNVRTFNAATGQLRNSFFAYESSFTGGVRVTVRDITGDGLADIITGAGLGGASRLRVFSGATLLPVEEFYAFNSAVRTGVYLG